MSWLPIETAPKDGTEVILLFGRDDEVLGKRVPRVRAACWCGDWSVPYYRENPPIAWQRMPLAPTHKDGCAKCGGIGVVPIGDGYSLNPCECCAPEPRHDWPACALFRGGGKCTCDAAETHNVEVSGGAPTVDESAASNPSARP